MMQSPFEHIALDLLAEVMVLRSALNMTMQSVMMDLPEEDQQRQLEALKYAIASRAPLTNGSSPEETRLHEMLTEIAAQKAASFADDLMLTLRQLRPAREEHRKSVGSDKGPADE